MVFNEKIYLEAHINNLYIWLKYTTEQLPFKNQGALTYFGISPVYLGMPWYSQISDSAISLLENYPFWNIRAILRYTGKNSNVDSLIQI